jgi:putative ABC transport system permease protein
MRDHVTHVLRLLRRRPFFCASVVTITAITIGACTAMFSLVSTVLFPRWTYDEAHRLALIWHAQRNAAGVIGLSPADYAAYRDNTRTFESIAAVTTRGYNLASTGAATRVTCARVTPGTLPTLGVNPARGRWPTDEEDRRDNRVVVLSHHLWRAELGGDEHAIGRHILLDAIPYQIVGIMPETFVFPPAGIQGLNEAACWVPTSFSAVEMATPAFNFVVVGRLKPGVTLEQASSDVAATTRQIWDAYPAAVKSQVQLASRVVGLVNEAAAASRRPLMLFTLSVILLFLIGCANISNLMLTRLHERAAEVSLRFALGATRRSVATHVILEPLVLAVMGSLLGAWLAVGILDLVVAVAPAGVPRLPDARIDVTALGVALGFGLLAGALAGAAPMLRANGRLAGGRAAARGFGRDRLSAALVVVQIAMAALVLSAAALLVRSILNLNQVNAGFDPRGVVAFSVALPPGPYPGSTQIDGFSRAVLERLREMPAVEAVAAGSTVPLGPTAVAVVAPGGARSGAPQYRPAAVEAVTFEHHRAWGIAIRRGRHFSPDDDRDSQPVALVNETMARAYWPDEDAAGKTMVRVGDARPLTIVGIVADVRQGGLDRAPVPTFYVPLAQTLDPARTLTFALQTTARATMLAPMVRSVVAETDGTLPIFAIRTGEDIVRSAAAVRRFNTLILTAFAVVAVILAAVGLYALIAHLVAASTRELGIRAAMGATIFGITRLVGTRALGLSVAGIALGCLAASGVSRLLGSLLYEVEPHDPVTLGTVGFVLLVMSAVSVLTPVVRAARVDPAAALRHE